MTIHTSRERFEAAAKIEWPNSNPPDAAWLGWEMRERQEDEHRAELIRQARHEAYNEGYNSWRTAWNNLDILLARIDELRQIERAVGVKATLAQQASHGNDRRL